MGKQRKQCQTLFIGASKSLQIVIAAMKLKDTDDRKTNMENAFAVNHPEQMYKKHILLVDDLITTGETMKACLRSMRRFRGATISVFALCKAR